MGGSPAVPHAVPPLAGAGGGVRSSVGSAALRGVVRVQRSGQVSLNWGLEVGAMYQLVGMCFILGIPECEADKSLIFSITGCS